MWGDIFKQNRKNLLDSIDLFEEHLQNARKMVEEENYEALEDWMKKANTLHEIL
jgi:prephenate dehydrogenase